MTYKVLSGTLNSAHSLTHVVVAVKAVLFSDVKTRFSSQLGAVLSKPFLHIAYFRQPVVRFQNRFQLLQTVTSCCLTSPVLFISSSLLIYLSTQYILTWQLQKDARYSGFRSGSSSLIELNCNLLSTVIRKITAWKALRFVWNGRVKELLVYCESECWLELGIIDSNWFDRANRIHVEFDSSVWFQLQKPWHNV